jgi:hypothetical protein
MFTIYSRRSPFSVPSSFIHRFIVSPFCRRQRALSLGFLPTIQLFLGSSVPFVADSGPCPSVASQKSNCSWDRLLRLSQTAGPALQLLPENAVLPVIVCLLCRRHRALSLSFCGKSSACLFPLSQTAGLGHQLPPENPAAPAIVLLKLSLLIGDTSEWSVMFTLGYFFHKLLV